MSAQRASSAVSADLRSIHPRLPGFPWWGAVVMAVTATVAGVAFDSANKELTNAFAALYVLGCVAAVLMVQQSGVFTAVIQPPLILFCAVPGAYWLFNGGSFSGVKTILINCGYPLIERFPLMLFTSAGVLLIGMGRWYFATATPPAVPEADEQATSSPGWLTSITRKATGGIAAVLQRHAAHAGEPTPAPRRRSADRPRRAATKSRTAARAAPRSTRASSDTARRFAPTNSQNGRPRAGDSSGRRAERPRRNRPGAADAEEAPLQRRRRLPPDSPRRGRPRHEPRREPHLRADPPPPRRRHAPKATNSADSTHHPISRVRYRNAEPDAESWNFDV